MSGMALLIACALFVGLGALCLLFWSIADGQYEDPDGDARRILIDAPGDTACGQAQAAGPVPSGPAHDL